MSFLFIIGQDPTQECSLEYVNSNRMIFRKLVIPSFIQVFEIDERRNINNRRFTDEPTSSLYIAMTPRSVCFAECNMFTDSTSQETIERYTV